MKKIFALMLAMVLVVSLSFSGVIAKKMNLQECGESDNLFNFAENKRSGYQTFSYFDSSHGYLGMEQYDGEGNLLIDTFDGVC